MPTKEEFFTAKQLAFQELFIGTFIYAVVLGFFNDYTSVVYAKSFSTIFFASIILEILTFLAFSLKKQTVAWLKGRDGLVYRIAMFVCVWLIMFLSKFVFIWAIDIIFGQNIAINGFFGILFIVLSVTIIHRLAYHVFKRLGSVKP